MVANQNRGDAYWDEAGAKGYGPAMYRSSDVESHVRGRCWQQAIDIANTLGAPSDGHVLDLGCGDGAFANQVLSTHYRLVEGLDKSEASIQRAQAEARGQTIFRAVDLAMLNYDSLPRYDVAFLIGILHHVKAATPHIVEALARRTGRMVVLEPNGDHLARKILEFIPSYRAAGEDSFRAEELLAIFEKTGWKISVRRKMNIFPNFTPRSIYQQLKRFEPMVEASQFWNALCTVVLYGLTTKEI
jgi:2-polyprenyl-3-methyl-5-hydroxy-6-metoxy-1,4-benzoquinol methylase